MTRFQPRMWLLSASIVLLVGCFGAENAHAPGASQHRSEETVALLANSAAAGVARVGQVIAGARDPIVLVLEEDHSSVRGQLEQAVTLLRLHEQKGLNQIILEGYLNDVPPIDLSWTKGKKQEVIAEVAATMLVDGEVSAAEFVNLALGISLVPAESSATYTSGPEFGPVAVCELIFHVALKRVSDRSLSTEDEAAMSRLAEDAGTARDEERVAAQRRLLEHIVGLDSQMSTYWAQLCAEQREYPSLESEIRTIDSLVKLADVARIDDGENLRSTILQHLDFLRARHEASRSFVQAMEQNMPDDVSIAAMIVGSAHTERVVELLKERDYPVAVVTPNALHESAEAGKLSLEEYWRKGDGLPVGEDYLSSSLAAAFEKKPEPVAGKNWFEAKSEIYYLTDRLTMSLLGRDAGGSADPPPPATPNLGGRGGGRPEIQVGSWDSRHVDLEEETIEIVVDGNGERVLVFALVLNPEKKQRARRIWVKSTLGQLPKPEASSTPEGASSGALEPMLLERIRELADRESLTEGEKRSLAERERKRTEVVRENEIERDQSRTVQITRNVKAVFAHSREEALRHALTRV